MPLPHRALDLDEKWHKVTLQGFADYLVVDSSPI